jgi:hypothetical protein
MQLGSSYITYPEDVSSDTPNMLINRCKDQVGRRFKDKTDLQIKYFETANSRDKFLNSS